MRGWRNIQTSLSKKTSFSLWASEILCCQPCLIEMKKEGSLEKVRSCIMFSPHHNLVAWKSWPSCFPLKKKCKKCILRKGCGERLLHSCCSEKSVIASSSWEIHCTKRTCHVFIRNLQQLTKTKNLSQVVPVKLSSDNFSINQIAPASRAPLLLHRLSTPSLFLHPSEKLSHMLNSGHLHKEPLEEVWTSVLVHCLHVPTETKSEPKAQAQLLGSGSAASGPRDVFRNSPLRISHLWQSCHGYS